MKGEARKKAAREKLLKKYPDFNQLDYEGSMRANLHWYNLEETDDVKKAWAILYWETQKKDVKGLAKVDKGYFPTVGAVAHMAHSRGIELSEEHLKWLDTRYNEIKARVPVEKEKVEAVKKEPDDNTSELIGELEGALDNWVEGFDVTSFLSKNEVKPAQATRISKWFSRHLKELQSIDSDEQLQEAYSHRTKRELKKITDLVQSFVDVCGSYARATKSRVVRKTRAKPAAVVVKNITLLKEVPELKLKSIPAERIVGATEVWFFDNEKRRLIKYAAQVGTKLTVKGKSIMNFDPDLSGSKILRKPEVQLEGAGNWTKRPANAIMNGIKATFTKVSGRVNDKMLLIGVF